LEVRKKVEKKGDNRERTDGEESWTGKMKRGQDIIKKGIMDKTNMKKAI
jgi:hypothetical protein